jgi:hypothetical protein
MPWERVKRLFGEQGHFLSVAVIRGEQVIEIMDQNGAVLVRLSPDEARMLAASLQFKADKLKPPSSEE